MIAACSASQSASPRLAGVRDPAAFWRGVTTPIIEPIAGTHDALVTFVGHRPFGVASQLCEGPGDCADPAVQLRDTEIWYRTYRLRDDFRIGYSLVVDGTHVADPLNPRAIDQGSPVFGRSILELPHAPPQPWNERRVGVPAGKVTELEVGDHGAWVYTPASYDATHEYPLLVCFDGAEYVTSIPGPTILDNLIADGKIPPMIGVFVAQGPQRNVELSNNPAFLTYVTDALLPAVRARWHVTTEPRHTTVCGSSTGGLASAYFAFRRPDVFGNVLGQSSALWPGRTRDDPAREWLTRQYDAAAAKPIRFVLQVGIVEHKPTPGSGPSILDTNRHLRDVLVRKGYEVHYHEIAGGHEPLSWRGGLADGLVELCSH